MSFSYNHIPLENRCYQSRFGKFRNWPAGDCFFGVPPDELYGRKPLTKIPRNANGFHFYLGADQESLFESFCDSDLPASAKSLHIGNSSYELGKGSNYSKLTPSLLQTKFPKLHTLELGVWQLFCNAHCAYGDVGRIDGLAAQIPQLQNLFVYGNFQLCTPLSIPTLEILHIAVDDPVTGLNDGPLDVDTVTSILSSSFPRLRELYLDLETEDEDSRYTLPDLFLNQNSFPLLAKLELAGRFRSGEKQRLVNSPLLHNRKVVLHLGEMLEVSQ